MRKLDPSGGEMRLRTVLAVFVAIGMCGVASAQAVDPGGNLIVVDSTGKVVGPVVGGFSGVFSLGHVTATMELNGISGVVEIDFVNGNMIPNDLALVYESADCSGDALVPDWVVSESPVYHSTYFQDPSSNVIYLLEAGTPFPTVNVESQLDQLGNCHASTFPKPAASLTVALADFTTVFTPPFRVEVSSAIFCSGFECWSDAVGTN
jgi:hypothetical protein